MKQFFSTALGAFVGTIVALFAFCAITVLFSIVGIIGISNAFTVKEAVNLVDNSILQIKLDGPIPEKDNTGNDIYSLIEKKGETTTLSNLISAIKIAAKEKHIKGIFLNCKGSEAGLAGSLEIRNALSEFKKSGKWIYAYGDAYTQADYYIASVADTMFINPEGVVDLLGLSTSIPYFKTLLDKVGIDMQVFKVGTFKSAVEPYILTSMSEANRLQTSQFLGNMWTSIATEMGKSRGMDLPTFNTLVDSIVLTRPTDYLLSKKLIDKKCYAFDFVNKLKKLTDTKEDGSLNFISPNDLNALQSSGSKKDKIAILYADGEINSASEEGIVAKDLIEKILSAKNDKTIKALVMRVNSPGGSAFDSEQIWAALEEFKKSKKPYAVSMGNYAASGGYYISCGADRIFAEPVTLTGSIGIFGMIPNLEKLTTNIGININEVATNPNANFPSILKPITPIQSQQMQNMINHGYELFTSRCATGRHMKLDSLKQIAEGRVWDGKMALKIGLVDELGGLQSAIDWVAKQAKLDKYSLVQMPDEGDPFTRFMNKYFSEIIANQFFTKYDSLIDQKQILMRLINIYPVQARTDITVEL